MGLRFEIVAQRPVSAQTQAVSRMISPVSIWDLRDADLDVFEA
jgi:hypothetical protein